MLRFPIELFKNPNGEITEFQNPVIKQERYLLNFENQNDVYFIATYTNDKNKNQTLSKTEILNYLKYV